MERQNCVTGVSVIPFRRLGPGPDGIPSLYLAWSQYLCELGPKAITTTTSTNSRTQGEIPPSKHPALGGCSVVGVGQTHPHPRTVGEGLVGPPTTSTAEPFF